MYRLGELSDSRRRTLGGGLLTLGLLGIVLGVIWIHWSSYSPDEVVDLLDWWPRGAIWKGLGYLVVLGSTTMALVGATFLWVLNQKMTWARATS